jgi:hypothetical protein
MTSISRNIGKLARPAAPAPAQLDIVTAAEALADDELTLAAVIEREPFDNVKKLAHNQLEAHAIYIAGTEGSVPRGFGDNLGTWPMKAGKTASWRDNITPVMESNQAVWWMGVLFRLWTPSDAHAGQLLMAVGDYMRTRAPDELRGPWRGLEQGDSSTQGRSDRPDRLPSLIVKFRAELMAVATRANISVWTDIGHSRHLDTLVEAERRRTERSLGIVADAMAGRKMSGRH